jgi:hypothetical protein
MDGQWKKTESKGEWDEWGRRGNVGPLFSYALLPPIRPIFSSPRSRATKVYSHAALPDKTEKANRSERAL